ncbi:MAG: MlaD family protein [Candidatus Levyibacteriota bacterium]
MEAKVNFTVVGIFVLALGAALIGGVLWLSSGKYYGRSYSLYRTYMTESVAGLELNSPVKYHGVDVGFVREIRLDPANAQRVELTLSILRGTPIKRDTVAVMGVQGVTGIAYVELNGGRPDSAALTAGPGEEFPVIASGASTFARLDGAVTSLIASMTRASDQLNVLLNQDNLRAVASTLADLQQVSRTLAARSAAIDAGLADLARTTRNTARASEALPALLQRIERSADSIDRMADAVAGAGTSATRTLDGTRADLERFTSVGLPEVRQLVNELRDVASTLQGVSVEIERNPSVLLWGRPPARRGPGE